MVSIRPRRGRPVVRPAAAVLATTGGPFTQAAVDAAADAAADGPVAVVAVARMHGFAFGMPHPGLLPTPAERATQADHVSAAVGGLDRRGVPHDEQIVITRNAAKAIARLAHECGATTVVLQIPAAGRLRRLVEGDAVRALRRRLGRSVTVHVHHEGAPAGD